MRRVLVAVVLVALTAGLAGAQQTQQGTAIEGTSAVPEGTGIVQYDPGAPADTIIIGATSRGVIGNRFDTRNGQPLSSGSIYRVTWYAGPSNSYGAGFLDVFGPASGTAAPFLFNAALPSPAPNTFNVLSFTAQPVGSSFLAGMYVPSALSFGSIGMRSATTNGQGFHAIQINWSSVSGSLYQQIPGQNAMMRAAGTIIVPVELTDFDLE